MFCCRGSHKPKVRNDFFACRRKLEIKYDAITNSRFFRKPSSGVAVLQPVFQITDPYLNLFRGILPPIFGLDLSPILAFVLLNALTSATAAVGAEMSESDKKKLQAASVFAVKPYKK